MVILGLTLTDHSAYHFSDIEPPQPPDVQSLNSLDWAVPEAYSLEVDTPAVARPWVYFEKELPFLHHNGAVDTDLGHMDNLVERPVPNSFASLYVFCADDLVYRLRWANETSPGVFAAFGVSSK